MLIIFLACTTTSTKFSLVWKDETYQGHPEKILVINAFPNPGSRRLFEEEFVKGLKDRRIDGVMSYTIMPDPVVSDKDAITAQAKEVGADTVLINKPLGNPRGELRGEVVAIYIDMQTDVYDMKSNRLVLSATEKTRLQHNTPSSALIAPIKSYAEDLVNKLSQQGLF
jgi:hypothetical protein